MKKFLPLFLAFGFCFAAPNVAVLRIWPLPSLLSYYVKDVNLTYIPTASYNAMKNSLNAKFRPEHLATNFGVSENLEELIGLNADLYICHLSQSEICDQLKSAGFKTLSLSTNIENYSSHATLKHWLTELEKFFDIKAKNEQLFSDIEAAEMEIKKRIGDANRPSAVVLHKILPDNRFVVGVFSDYLLNASGAKNAVGYIDGTKTINLEELFSLDPDILYLTNFTPQLPAEIYEMPEFASLKAVKNKKVFKFPLASYRPQAPSVDLPVFLKFLAKTNHPNLFEDVDLYELYKAHFKKYYEIDLSEDDFNLIMNPKKEAGILE